MFGMGISHELAAGMGGIRTAGDLVARMVLKGMKLKEAKEYVAKKIGCTVMDLTDSAMMKEIRESLDIGTTLDRKHAASGIVAKMKIAELLDIRIPSVEIFKKNIGKA
jgi:Dimethylamine methyltransferase (Dimeth_PyL)